MAAKTAQVKLTAHRQNGTFKTWKKRIGGRLFYLSADLEIARRMAWALQAAWSQVQATGSGWTEEVIAAALSLAGGNGKGTARAAVGSQRVHAAIADYLAEYKNKVSPSRYLRHVIALNDYKRQQPDMPLRLIGWNKLDATVAHYRKRPMTGHGAPMAVATIMTTLKAILAFLDWCDVTGRWEAPRRFERLFKIKYAALKTPLEMQVEGNGSDTFSLSELITLWQAATDRQRLYMGIALNTGELAAGIGNLLKTDLVKKGGQLIIDRHRTKTGVRGVYPLWPEVARLVESQMDRHDDEALLFKSMDGKPLVWFHATGRVDSIAKTWANLLTKCPSVRRLGFSVQRKTGASLIRDLTGSIEVAQTYLSHKGQSVAEKHYLSLSFDRLAGALDKLHTYLAPIFTAQSQVKAQAA